MTETFPLRALRIPEGWTIEYNSFDDIPLDHPEAWSLVFKASLFMAKHYRRNVLVDLGWLPDEDPSGAYVLRAFENDFTGKELFRLDTRSDIAAVDALESLLLRITAGDIPQWPTE
ncbi:MAG TPA: hypothetical protein PK585_07050 [Amphiplicatus sp.]|nr:hypothetical protein [Amphiplicatus sp.]HRX39554.1 hypothetical protein [Parvularculaceae bacterium]